MLSFSNIGNALRWLRKRRGMKQAEVAQAAGITSPMLSAYETGKHRPSLATIDKILGALDCDVRHLATALKVSPAEAAAEGPSEPEAIPIDDQEVEPPSLQGQISRLIDGESLGEVSETERKILAQTLSGLTLLARHVKG